MRYFADTSFDTTIEDPIFLLRVDGSKMVEVASKNQPFWQKSQYQNNLYLSGDIIYWDDITEEQANKILNMWKTKKDNSKTE